MLGKFKELADVCHPDNLANGTLELNTVYQSGNIAMQTQYHEFAASIEDETKSRAAGGKTAYAIYLLEGDTLTLTANEPGDPNVPGSFDAPGARQFVFKKEPTERNH